MGFGHLRLAAQRGRQNAVKHAQVHVCLTVLVAFIQLGHSFHGGLDAAQFGDSVPVAGILLDVAGPSSTQGKQDRHIALARVGQQGLVFRHAKAAQLTVILVVSTGRPEGIIQGLVAQLAGTGRIFHKQAGIGAVEVRTAGQQRFAFRPVFDQPIDHQQVGRQAILDQLQIVVVEYPVRQVVIDSGQRAAL